MRCEYLTSRQIDVLRLKAEGMTNRQVGALLFVSEKTVKAHLQSASRTLAANSTLHAVVLAHRNGFINLDETAKQEVAS